MFKRILLNAALSTLNTLLVSAIKSQDLQQLVKTILDFTERIVGALTDNDKEDKKQIQLIWQEERNNLATAAIDLVEIVIREKIENEDLRNAALVQVKALKEILTLAL